MIYEADRRLTRKNVSDNIFIKVFHFYILNRDPEEERK